MLGFGAIAFLHFAGENLAMEQVYFPANGVAGEFAERPFASKPSRFREKVVWKGYRRAHQVISNCITTDEDYGESATL